HSTARPNELLALVHESATHEIYLHGNLVPRELTAAVLPNLANRLLRVGVLDLDLSDDDAAHQNVRLLRHASSAHEVELEDRLLDLRRIHFLAAHVDGI